MATLNDLPAELIIVIAKEVKLSGHSLARLVTISRYWQAQTKSIIFSDLTICASELQQYDQMLDRRRFLALRDLSYRIDDIPLEDPNDKTSVRIGAGACAKYSQAFMRSVRNLYTMLKNKCDDDKAGALHPGIALRLRNHSFTGKGSLYLPEEHGDGEASGNDDEDSDSGEESDAVPYDDDWDGVSDDDDQYDEYGPESRLKRAWLTFLGDDLPIVPVVTKFDNQDDPGSPFTCLFEMIRPQTWSRIASYLPNLKVVDLYAYDNERRGRGGRLEARNAFGESLRSLPSIASTVSLMYSGSAPLNHFRRSPCLTDETLGYDIFSHELGPFSQRLVSLEIFGGTLNFVDFFDCNTHSDWPYLEKLVIREAQPASTDGTWYFAMDPNMPREDHSRNDIRALRSHVRCPTRMDRPLELFRIALTPAKFEEIYIAAAKAVKRMRKLRSIFINFELNGHFGGPGNHMFIYEAGHPCEPQTLATSSTADIKAEWTIIPSIEFPDEVVSAWREVGSAKDASIELYLIDNPDDLVDYRLVE